MELSGELSTISILLIGFALGLQHAVEADHLAAVSTIVSEKKSLLIASIVGGFWGLGHTIALLAVGAVVIFLKVQISETAEARLEGAVGVMLVLVGVNALRKLLSADKVHVHEHDHDGHKHIHVHTHAAGSEPSHHRVSARSILIGLVHGLAGSAALMLLILPVIPSPAVAMLYILVFGVGSIGGMTAMSVLIGLPLHFTAGRFNFLNGMIRGAAGIFSLCLGGYIVYEKLIA